MLMDTVTYPQETVREELGQHWLKTKIDVSEQTSVAQRFGVVAIPVAIAVSGDGEVLGRILGFVGAEPFARQLEQLREAR